MASSFAGFIEDIKAFVLTLPYDDDDGSQRSLEINEHNDDDDDISNTMDSTGDGDAELKSDDDNGDNSAIDDDDARNSGDATGYHLNVENDPVEVGNQYAYSQVTSDSHGDYDNGDGNDDDHGNGDDDDLNSDNGSATFVQALSEMPAEWETSEEEQPNASSLLISGPDATATPTHGGTTASRDKGNGDHDSDGDNEDDEPSNTSASENTHTGNEDSNSNAATTTSPFLSGPNSPHKIEIRPMGFHKGLGMVALQPNEVNETIHTEAPLLVCPAGARSAREMQSFMLAAMAPLSEPDREFVVHGLTNASGCRADVENHLAGVYRTNALPCGVGERFGAVFKVLAMANHSCVPNARYRWVAADESGEMKKAEAEAGVPKGTEHKNEDAQKSVVHGHDEKKQNDASITANDAFTSNVSTPESVTEPSSPSSTPRPAGNISSRSNLQAEEAKDIKTNKNPGKGTQEPTTLKTTHNTTRNTKPTKPTQPTTTNTTTTIKGHGTFTALEPIPAGTEITISYIPHAPHTARRSQLHSSFNFWCTCPLCSLPAGSRRDAEDTRTAEIEGLELTLFSEPVAQMAATALSGASWGASARMREGGKMRVRELLAKFERLLALYDGSEVNREPEALCACAAAVRLCVIVFEREEAVRLVGGVCGFEEEVARGLCEEAAAEMEFEEEE